MFNFHCVTPFHLSQVFIQGEPRCGRPPLPPLAAPQNLTHAFERSTKMSLTTLALAKIALTGVAGASPTLMPNAKTEIVRHTQHSQATLCDGEWVEVTTTVPFGPLAGHSTTFDELRGVTVILKSDGETWELQNGNWQLIT